MNGLHRAALVAALIGAATALTAGPALAGLADKTVFKTRGNVSALSASGKRVALIQDIDPGQCDRLVVWRPTKRTASRLPKTDACSSSLASTGQGISDLLLVGQRLVWIEFGGGNFRELTVYSTRLDTRKQRIRRHTDFLPHRVGSRWGYDGRYIGGLRGHPASRKKQELIVWNTWTGCFFSPGEEGAECEPPPALTPTEPQVVNWDETLDRLDGNRVRSVLDGPGALFVVAAGDERIAVHRRPLQPPSLGGREPVPASPLAVLETDGTVSSTFTLPAGTYRGTHLTNNAGWLVTLRDDAVEIYATTDGTLVGSYPVTAPNDPARQRFGLTSVRKGLATYVSGKRIVVVRLSDGASFSIRPARASGSVDAQLVNSGLFYSHNVGPTTRGKKNGRVVYLTRSLLDERLAR